MARMVRGAQHTYEVWYWKPEHARNMLMGCKFVQERGLLPERTNLAKTHIKVKELKADDPEDAYYHMQAEQWSPNGEARQLIESLGLSHTTMSVGDILIDKDYHQTFMIDIWGTTELK